MWMAAFIFAVFDLRFLHPARLALAILIVLILAVWALVRIARDRARELYRRHVRETRRERQIVAALGFYVAFAAVRVLTHAIRAGRGPFHNIEMGGRHIHHLVWGISLLLLVGYAWLLQIGTGEGRGSRWAGRVMSFLYGVGAALTLDEFALWLNLRDVYWEREGRASIDAVLLFGSLLAIGVLGLPFLRALVKEAARITSGRASGTPPPP
jgi:hypothetical protein